MPKRQPVFGLHALLDNYSYVWDRVLAGLSLTDAVLLCGVNRRAYQAVTEQEWDETETRIRGSLRRRR